ncbi:hypothetical protein JG688_00000579 [Phytophthora aleatoria]|uniref:CRC domain-containing protein n=1 Tax=Phytophthora aleatoria TaxID=2496075 RepID=A0A8J5J669_9STRA|nr:hypothetical protein JG688_00000579 [Phytophthora aleatoria]
MNPDDAALSGRRRGCNCKKSGCLKLYCECFAAGGRCSERCQCVSCKNQEHNQEEIAQAIQAIEKRTQKSFRPTSKASDLETMAEPANQPPRSSMTNRETPATFPTERKAVMAMAEAAVPAVELPNVEDTVTNAYDARNTEGVGDPELTILSRSLLHTAMAVEFAEEEKEAADIPSTGQASLDQQTGVSKPLRTPDPSDGREALSPTAAGLFCEEEYSEAAADDHALATNGNRTTSHSNTTDHEGNHKETNLSVMQERAVLQEFSVWLRNLATGLSQ